MSIIIQLSCEPKKLIFLHSLGRCWTLNIVFSTFLYFCKHKPFCSFVGLSSLPLTAPRRVLLRGRSVAQQCAMFSSALLGAVKYALVQTGSYRQARQRVLTHWNRCQVGVCIKPCNTRAVYWFCVALIDARDAVKMEAAVALEASRHSLLLVCLCFIDHHWWMNNQNIELSLLLSVIDQSAVINVLGRFSL